MLANVGRRRLWRNTTWDTRQLDGVRALRLATATGWTVGLEWRTLGWSWWSTGRVRRRRSFRKVGPKVCRCRHFGVRWVAEHRPTPSQWSATTHTLLSTPSARSSTPSGAPLRLEFARASKIPDSRSSILFPVHQSSPHSRSRTGARAVVRIVSAVVSAVVAVVVAVSGKSPFCRMICWIGGVGE